MFLNYGNPKHKMPNIHYMVVTTINFDMGPAKSSGEVHSKYCEGVLRQIIMNKGSSSKLGGAIFILLLNLVDFLT